MDIGSIWYMLRETWADRSYTKEVARKRGFQYISVAVRADLCDYINGHIDSCEGLDKAAESRKRRADDDVAQRSKRSREVRPDAKAVATGTPGEISSADVAARVRPVKDLDVLVRCPGRLVPNADLILKISQDEWRNWHAPEAASGEKQNRSKLPLRLELEAGLRQSPDNKPIILVPCNKHAPVNLLNAVDLLQHGTYRKADEERVRFFESTRPEFVEVTRNIAGKIWTFEVRDQAKSFTKAQWLRTVAIVTDSNEWQFKGWPFETIVDMFTSIRGVFFQVAGMPPPQHIKLWACRVLHMAPVRMEHRFSATRDSFFQEVEEFMESYRQRKFVNHTSLQPARIEKILERPIL